MVLRNAGAERAGIPSNLRPYAADLKGQFEALGLKPDDLRGWRMRWDNPWLHLVYVQSELDLMPDEWEVQGKAELWLLQRYVAASGLASCNFTDRRLTASLEARPLPLSGTPRVGG